MSKVIRLKTEILLEGLLFPECPRWHGGKLWFSDMDLKKVMTIDINGNKEMIIETENSPAGLGWTPDNKLLVVSMQDRRLFKLDNEGFTVVADLSNLAKFHCNDMVVDKKGRAYIGNFGFDWDNKARFEHAEVILVTPDGKARVVADNMSFPNGSVITPDDRTLIVAETFAARLSAFTIEEDGSLSERRVWAQLKSAVADGICLDEEGAIWVAAPGIGKVLRVLEGGKVSHKVKVSTQAYACMLGGPNRTTLYVTTSTNDRLNGKIEFVEVDVAGTGLP
jgi:sugar lactone lactonase YvrE